MIPDPPGPLRAELERRVHSHGLYCLTQISSGYASIVIALTPRDGVLCVAHGEDDEQAAAVLLATWKAALGA